MLVKDISIPCFPFEIKIVQDTTIKKCLENLNFTTDSDLDFVQGLFVEATEINLFLIFPKNPDINTVAHECTHLSNYIVKYLCEKSKSDELLCYLNGYFVEQVVNTIRVKLK